MAAAFVSKASLTDFCNVDDDSVVVPKESWYVVARKYLSCPPPFYGLDTDW